MALYQISSAFRNFCVRVFYFQFLRLFARLFFMLLLKQLSNIKKLFFEWGNVCVCVCVYVCALPVRGDPVYTLLISPVSLESFN